MNSYIMKRLVHAMRFHKDPDRVSVIVIGITSIASTYGFSRFYKILTELEYTPAMKEKTLTMLFLAYELIGYARKGHVIGEMERELINAVFNDESALLFDNICIHLILDE